MKMLRQFLMAAALSILGLTASAQDPKTYYNISDDGYAIVPIPFGFPYFGRVFTHSIFFDNGVVSFYDPVTEGMRLGGQNFYAQPLSDNIGSNFHYSIMPLWTDLRNYSGSYYTETDSKSYLRYNWENISQYGYPDRLNSFDLEIRPTGFIGINYTKINIGGYPITAGLVGNAQLGEWNQHYYKPPQDTATLSSIQNWSVPFTQGTDCSNPLNNQYCPGYQQAYFTQQCSASTLYDPACPGYATAYYDYQCSVNALYHTGCQGYDVAYFDQQCSLDALYNEKCPGYDDAYYVQQCNANALYDSGCTGYDDAYFNQQCTANALYDITCPGYEIAYFNQQCGINGLYDRTCPNYGESYAKQNVLSEPIVETVTVEQVVAQLEPVDSSKEFAQLESPKTEVSAAVVVPITQQEKPKNDTTTSTTTSPTTTTARVSETSSTEKTKPKTNRQAIIERRQAAAKEKAAESGAETTGEMQSADSMEKQVELQNVVLQVMGFTPGFDAYSSLVVPDGQMYKPFSIYDNQRNVDSRAGSRLFGATDNAHRQMTDAQYQLGN